MKNLELAKKYYDDMVRVRRHMHEYPELTGKEYETVKYIDEELNRLGVEHVVVENGGILGFIRGKKQGPVVLLRADCDALPIQEKDNIGGCRTVWSKNDGAMHACGHDSHTASLLGAAGILLDRADEICGTVILCFERGEEGGGNCKYLFAYMDKNGIKPDTCLGLHTSVDLETGHFCVYDTNANAGSMPFKITIEGRGGHGSRPDLSVNPIDCFAAIYQRMQSLRLVSISPYETLTYSIGSLHTGNAGNVIPTFLDFSGTMRTYDSEGAGMVFHNEFKKAVEEICEAYGCKAVFNVYPKPGLATINEREYSRFTQNAFAKEFGEDALIHRDPSMGSESFAMFLKQWPGVYADFGVHNPAKGTGARGHNEKFDIDEDSMLYAAAAYATYGLEFGKLDEQPAFGPKKCFRDILVQQGREAEIGELYGE